jgi:hypothetical protein
MDPPLFCGLTMLVNSSTVEVFYAHFLWVTNIQYINTLQYEYGYETGHRASYVTQIEVYISVAFV